MKYYFIPKIEINVCLTDLEFNILDAAIKNSEYKHVAVIGGWWYGMSGMRHWKLDSDAEFRSEIPYAYTFRKLDKLLKCLEPFVNYPNEKQDQATEVYLKISKILQLCNNHYNAISESFPDNLIKL